LTARPLPPGLAVPEIHLDPAGGGAAFMQTEARRLRAKRPKPKEKRPSAAGAEIANGRPNAVGTKIGDRGLDFDDHEVARLAEAMEMRAIGEWERGSHSRPVRRERGRRRAPEGVERLDSGR
jgi:hypothetical protein